MANSRLLAACMALTSLCLDFVRAGPIVQSASNKVIAFNNTGEGFTIPLYFGTKPQYHEQATFVVDTTFSDILVATNQCGPTLCKYPVYNMQESTTCQQKYNTT